MWASGASSTQVKPKRCGVPELKTGADLKVRSLLILRTIYPQKTQGIFRH